MYANDFVQRDLGADMVTNKYIWALAYQTDVVTQLGDRRKLRLYLFKEETLMNLPPVESILLREDLTPRTKQVREPTNLTA